MTDVIKTTRRADVWIEESKRPYNLSVNELMEATQARKFKIDVDNVESAIANIMIACEWCDPDTLLAASAIVFLMVVRRFNLKLASVLQFAENFLKGDDKKPTCWALRQMLHDDYESQVTRYETVKLSRAVNLTKVLNQPKR